MITLEKTFLNMGPSFHCLALYVLSTRWRHSLASLTAPSLPFPPSACPFAAAPLAAPPAAVAAGDLKLNGEIEKG